MRPSRLFPPNAVTTFGTKLTPIARPVNTPAHAKTRATNPSRQPPNPAPRAVATIATSSAFIRPPEVVCESPRAGGRG